MHTSRHAAAIGTALLACLLASFAPDARSRDGATTDVAVAPAVELRRTSDGIPHIRAGNWRDLGQGVGHVQADDALCTLAEAFVTFEGRRSYFFGANEKPARISTFGQSTNIDLDFFFRAFADADMVQRYRAEQPRELNELIEGYAAGYNRYLAQARSGHASHATHRCLRQPWVRAITSDDIYRRMYAAQLAAGYAHFIPQLANAQPASAHARQESSSGRAQLQRLFAHRVGDQPALGSNAIAFGRKATGEEGGVLLGNPHWYWGGPDRFYQMHLTIPGRLDVAGVAFLGIPVVMIGFNHHVAWSHTVSEARRFGLFELTLDPADPTRYRVDGQPQAMQARRVAVEVRGDAGKPRRVERTFYRSRFGPMVDLGAQDAAFGWGRERALALRDVNADNFRVFRNFFYWNQARSLEEFIEIQRREAAVPWVNTVAIGRGDGRVWYADVGAVPNVPDALRKSCAASLAEGFAQVDALTPLLDGSRSACDWLQDPAAVQPGAMPAGGQPSLLRDDYVANMNDSYWLTQPAQPLEGYPALLGGERAALSLRSRLGHEMAQALLQAQAGSSARLAHRLMHDALHPRVYSAEQFKSALLGPVCRLRRVDKVDVAAACDVLMRWANTANADDRGALLWEAFWRRVREIPEAELFQQPFSPGAPLATPHQPNGADPRVARALADAVTEFRRAGRPLDEPLGRRRFVRSEGQRVPLYGGCHGHGNFVVACNESDADAMSPDSLANTYLQVVRFTPEGVEAHTLLAHGQRETAVSNGDGIEPVRRYADRQWLRFPFTEDEIARDPALQRATLPALQP
jgi:acyl-homoserine-lactone acylase